MQTAPAEVETLYSLNKTSKLTGRTRETLARWVLEGRIEAIVCFVGPSNRRRFCFSQRVVEQLLAGSPQRAA